MIVKHCLRCNGEFETYPSQIKRSRGKFCSLSCRSIFNNRRRVSKALQGLGSEELKKLYEQGLSCSEIAERFKCSATTIGRRLKKAGLKLRSRAERFLLAVKRGRWVLDSMGEKHNQWKGGRHLNTGGYWKVYKPDHPNANQSYILEHRLIWEETNGKRLPPNWIVHHLNGIKTDNRPENLVGMERGRHTRIEMGERLKKRIRELEEELRGRET